jgi:hypothetical protein
MIGDLEMEVLAGDDAQAEIVLCGKPCMTKIGAKYFRRKIEERGRKRGRYW